MKKLIALLICAVMVITLAACGKTGPETTDAPEADTEELTEADETTEDAQTDDADIVKEMQAQLTGSWSADGFDEELLTFNADGTGTYTGLGGKNHSFTYTMSVEHKFYNNGDEYLIYPMTVVFDSGDTEVITINFREENGTELVFHNSDWTSGYSGIMNFDVYKKA